MSDNSLTTPPKAPVKAKRQIKPRLLSKEESDQDKEYRNKLIQDLKDKLHYRQGEFQCMTREMSLLLNVSAEEVAKQIKNDNEYCLLCDRPGDNCTCIYTHPKASEVYLKLVLKQEGEKLVELNYTDTNKLEII